MQHFMEWPEVVRATAYFYYYKEGQYSKLIHHLKYYDHPEVGTFLGRLAATELKPSGFFDGIDLIIPIPLSKKKYHKRGYNQCDYIAHGISQIIGADVDSQCIKRIIDTNTQTQKNRTERWRNTENIFQVINTDTLKGRHILLVDDVATTGATLHACISAILMVPNVRISIFTLTKAV
jgi:ComF family protein